MRQTTIHALVAALSVVGFCSVLKAQCRDFASIGNTDSDGVVCMTTFDEDGPGPNPPRLFVGGTFDHINGIAARGVARWDGTSWSALGDGLFNVNALAVYDDGSGPAIYAGGGFETPSKLAKWNGAAWVDVGSGLTATSVYALTVYNDGSGPALFAGGGIVSAGGAPTDNVAAWNGTSWRTFFAGPSARLFPSVAYDSIHGNLVIFGGRLNNGGSNPTVNETWTWSGSAWFQATQPAGTAPAARTSAPMCFDSTRGRTIMLGGSGNDLRTWAFDGTTWTMIVPTYLLSSQRTNFRIAYDAARDRVVLFGGTATYQNSLQYNDTWEFDGTSWAQVFPTASPPIRENYAMTYDSARHHIVLFGGVESHVGYYNDTWEYDGTTWTRVSTSGPAGTESATMTFDTARSRAVMFGAIASQPNLQTWAWNGTAWSLLNAGIPSYSFRNGAPIAYDIAHDRVVQRDPTGVQWSWNNTAWTTTPGGGGPGGAVNKLLVHNDGSGPALYAGGVFSVTGGNSSSPDIARLTASGWGPVGNGFNGSVASMASYNGSLFAAGTFSYAGSVQVDGLARWNGTTWSAVNIPGGTRALRGGGPLAAVTDETGPVMFAAGPSGWSSILRWNGAWSPISSTTPQPTAREYAAMAYDTARSRCVLFGGTTDGTPTGSRADTYEWDGRTWYQTATTGPSARWGHIMAFDSLRSRILLVGGGTSFSTANNETWSWDGAVWTQLAPSFGTTARFQSAAAYDIARDRLVLFGGRDASGAPQNDTWEWNGSAWTQRALSGPGARYAHAMAYDPDRHRIVMTGGIDSLGHQFYDTWEFDGSQWSLANNNPSNFTGPISEHSMVYNTARQRTVIYGGRSGNYPNGTIWQWDGQAWTSSGSCDLWGCAAAYDSRMQTLTAFGGFWSTQTVDTTGGQSDSGTYPSLGTFGGALNHDDGSGPSVFVIGSLLGNPASRVAKWSVPCSAPTITTDPESQTAVYGQNVAFTVSTSGGTTPLTYQWRRNGVNLHNVNNYIIGATTPSLTIHGWSLNDAGQYDVVVAGPAGVATSNPATLTITGSVPGSPVTVTRIVYPPDPIPGIPGSAFTTVDIAQLAPTDEVLFLANGTGTGRILCLWDGGALQTLYKFGDTIAGTNPGEYVGGSGGGGSMFPRFGVMGSRRIWFTTDLAGPGVNVTNRRGLWYQDDSGATLVARRGYQPVGYPAGTVLSQFGDIYPSSSSAGSLAFTSWVDVNSSRTGGGAWTWTSASGQSIVARTGDPAPGYSSNFGYFGNGACINASGSVLLGANEPSSASGLWIASEGTVAPVLVSGSAAPGAPSGSTILGVSIDGNVLSESGRAAFSANFVPPAPFGQAVIYRTDPTGITPIVTKGDPAAGAPDGDTFNVPTLWSMNDAGEVLFASGLTQPPNSCPAGNCPTKGLWIARSDGIHSIILDHTTPPAGTPAVFDNITASGPGVVNNSGIIIFGVALTGPSQPSATGIYGWTSDDGAFPIIVPGTQMEVRPGLFKTVSNSWLSGLADGSNTLTTNLNDNGEMTAIVSFTDESRGLFLGRFGDFLVGSFPCRAFVSPLLASVAQGATATFAASASGQNVTYRWQRNGADLSDNSRISGSHTSVLIISNTQPSDAGYYVCNVTNSCGQTASPTATLAVTTHCGSADFNCDGDLGTDADIGAFFACISGNCPPPPCTSTADFNGDGDLGTDADIEAFFRVLAGGSC